VRKVNVTEFLSVDGVMEAPQEWNGEYFDEGVGQFKQDELFASDALLLGRVTYEGFAAAWPERTDEAGFADRINSLPKHVVSTTLKEPAWNNSTVISSNVAEEVRKLKQAPGEDILVYGSAQLVNFLMQEDLIDEYQLMIFPVVVGSGKRLFHEGIGKSGLKLVKTTPFDSGVVVLTYQPDRSG
jgi:dihydrofolate reductase